MSTRMTICLAALLTVALAADLPRAAAQTSSFTQQQLSSVSYGTSASNYTIDQQSSRVLGRGLNVGGYSPASRNLASGLLKNYRPSSSPARPANKPFSGASSGPNVTPYLSLSSPFSSTSTNYYTQVRPQLQQQNVNRQVQQQAQRQQSQNLKFQQELTTMAARPPFDPSGSEMMAPTGHPAVFQDTLGQFQNLGGYYPPSRR